MIVVPKNKQKCKKLLIVLRFDEFPQTPKYLITTLEDER